MARYSVKYVKARKNLARQHLMTVAEDGKLKPAGKGDTIIGQAITGANAMESGTIVQDVGLQYHLEVMDKRLHEQDKIIKELKAGIEEEGNVDLTTGIRKEVRTKPFMNDLIKSLDKKSGLFDVPKPTTRDEVRTKLKIDSISKMFEEVGGWKMNEDGYRELLEVTKDKLTREVTTPEQVLTPAELAALKAPVPSRPREDTAQQITLNHRVFMKWKLAKEAAEEKLVAAGLKVPSGSIYAETPPVPWDKRVPWRHKTAYEEEKTHEKLREQAMIEAKKSIEEHERLSAMQTYVSGKDLRPRKTEVDYEAVEFNRQATNDLCCVLGFSMWMLAIAMSWSFLYWQYENDFTRIIEFQQYHAIGSVFSAMAMCLYVAMRHGDHELYRIFHLRPFRVFRQWWHGYNAYTILDEAIEDTRETYAKLAKEAT